MGWTKRLSVRWCGVVMLVGVGLARSAGAIFLDEDQTISLRSRIYSQAAIRATDWQGQTTPPAYSGQLIQNRNFFNPELEAKLTSYTSWMKGTWLDFMAPDNFSGRLAAWGFYDGIYDYGSRQFARSAANINATYPTVPSCTTPGCTLTFPSAFYLEGPTVNLDTAATSIDQVFPGSQNQDPHDIYASQRRVNELYLNYTKGPLFVRIGRQAISWGESDTIAILDQNNPFDLTLAAPGLYEDLDEARIPLWTVRTSYNLFDTLGPLSSGFIEAYWVPGDLDINTGTLPLLTASPYSPPGQDPQSLVTALGGGLIQAQFVLIDHVPKKRFDSSRYGFRVQSIVNRTFTVSGWFYTAFPSQPVPLSHGTIASVNGTKLFVTETVHDKKVNVFGVGNSFFFEPLDSIVRMEAEFFHHEPGFVPEHNLGVNTFTGSSAVAQLCILRPQAPDCLKNNPLHKLPDVPLADYLRWELGLDRFFFLRALNPTNSFTWVTAMVGQYNMSETSQTDFRFSGQSKQSVATPTSPDDYVQQKKVEVFAQTHLQTDYLHGRLTPAVTIIVNARGTYAVQPDLLYRYTDWLLFDLNYINIGGEFAGVGFFRDRDQVSIRATYQLN
jgi:hypothetical protein